MARIFKPDPNTEIAETPATAGKSIDEVKQVLGPWATPRCSTVSRRDEPR